MSTHTTGGSIAPLDSGSVGFGLAELVEHLMNERAGAMGIANFGDSREVAFNEQPSPRCSATETALASDTLVFHKAVFFLSLNSAPQH